MAATRARPAAVSLRYRPVAETQDDLDRQRRDASAALLPRLTEALHRHLVALAEPRERIEVFGFAGRPDHRAGAVARRGPR
ncbi:hypothetical protein GS444_16650 [Rhodococcus hoagii]|nr:hypothetical protein [Prescottella equi]